MWSVAITVFIAGWMIRNALVNGFNHLAKAQQSPPPPSVVIWTNPNPPTTWVQTGEEKVGGLFPTEKKIPLSIVEKTDGTRFLIYAVPVVEE